MRLPRVPKILKSLKMVLLLHPALDPKISVRDGGTALFSVRLRLWRITGRLLSRASAWLSPQLNRQRTRGATIARQSISSCSSYSTRSAIVRFSLCVLIYNRVETCCFR